MIGISGSVSLRLIPRIVAVTPGEAMFPFFVAFNKLSRMPVRETKAAADADAHALGNGAKVKGLTTAQAQPLIKLDEMQHGAIAALVVHNGARLDAHIARMDARYDR
jgi:hypothetical protein